jgi:hypothetical protein
MQISEFTIRLLLLFLPGLVTFLIIESLTVSKTKSNVYFFIYSFILGFFNYFTYYLILKISALIFCHKSSVDVKFLIALFNKNALIDYKEIIFVSFLAVINGFLLSLLVNRKFLHRFAQWAKITKKFAEIDVWDYVFNSENDEMKWIIVREIKNDLMYQGWIEAFSDTVKENELFLRDVIVYKNSTAEEYYSVSGLYISRNKDDIVVEFPSLK